MNDSLTYQMGLAVGQSIYQAKQETIHAVAEMNQQVTEKIDHVSNDYAATARRVRIMRLNDLLGLGI